MCEETKEPCPPPRIPSAVSAESRAPLSGASRDDFTLFVSPWELFIISNRDPRFAPLDKRRRTDKLLGKVGRWANGFGLRALRGYPIDRDGAAFCLGAVQYLIAFIVFLLVLLYAGRLVVFLQMFRFNVEDRCAVIRKDGTLEAIYFFIPDIGIAVVAAIILLGAYLLRRLVGSWRKCMEVYATLMVNFWRNRPYFSLSTVLAVLGLAYVERFGTALYLGLTGLLAPAFDVSSILARSRWAIYGMVVSLGANFFAQWFLNRLRVADCDRKDESLTTTSFQLIGSTAELFICIAVARLLLLKFVAPRLPVGIARRSPFWYFDDSPAPRPRPGSLLPVDVPGDPAGFAPAGDEEEEALGENEGGADQTDAGARSKGSPFLNASDAGSRGGSESPEPLSISEAANRNHLLATADAPRAGQDGAALSGVAGGVKETGEGAAPRDGEDEDREPPRPPPPDREDASATPAATDCGAAGRESVGSGENRGVGRGTGRSTWWEARYSAHEFLAYPETSADKVHARGTRGWLFQPEASLWVDVAWTAATAVATIAYALRLPLKLGAYGSLIYNADFVKNCFGRVGDDERALLDVLGMTIIGTFGVQAVIALVGWWVQTRDVPALLRYSLFILVQWPGLSLGGIGVTITSAVSNYPFDPFQIGAVVFIPIFEAMLVCKRQPLRFAVSVTTRAIALITFLDAIANSAIVWILIPMDCDNLNARESEFAYFARVLSGALAALWVADLCVILIRKAVKIDEPIIEFAAEPLISFDLNWIEGSSFKDAIGNQSFKNILATDDENLAEIQLCAEHLERTLNGLSVPATLAL